MRIHAVLSEYVRLKFVEFEKQAAFTKIRLLMSAA